MPSLFIHLRLAAGSLQSPAKLKAMQQLAGPVPMWCTAPTPSQGTLFHFQSSESVSNISGSSKNEGSPPIFGFPPDRYEF